MNKTLEKKYSSWILKRNSKSYINYKVNLRFYILLFLGLAAGLVFFFIGRSNQMIFDPEHIRRHFDSMFKSCISPSDYFVYVIKISKSDLGHIFFIFVSGFTYFCFAISGIIVFFKGFMLSFSILYLVNSSGLIWEMSLSNYFIIIFGILKLLQSVLVVSFCSEAYMFSYDFRSIKRKHKLLVRSPIAYKFIFFLFQTIGISILLNFIYCILIYVI